MIKKDDFLVLLVGRPNVGKSTIFNKIIGSMTANTSKTPGTTLDINIKETSYMGFDFLITDSGGFNLNPVNDIEKKIKTKVFKYAKNAKIVLLVVDYKSGLIPEDLEIYRHFIKEQAKIFLVINKVDSIKDMDNSLVEFGQIGGVKKFTVSAEKGIGIDDVLEKIIEELKSSKIKTKKQKPAEETIKISIVGKPNSGKSTYVNSILKEDLIFTDEKPGTTRDSIDAYINYKGKKIILIDTAGIRKKSKLDFNSIDFQKQTLASIKKSDVVCVLIDISSGITHEDLSLLELVNLEKKQSLIAFTKWDLIGALNNKLNDKINPIRNNRNKDIKLALKEFAGSPYLFISSKDKKNIYKLIDNCIEIYESNNIKIKTGEINKFVAERKNDIKKGRIFKHITYGVQKTDALMPTFIFFTDNKGKIFTMMDIKHIRSEIKDCFGIKSNVEVLIEYKRYN